LHAAVAKSILEMCCWLWGYCCWLWCLQDKTGRTALHWAAECNQIEAAQTLIDYGCNVKALEGMGRCEHAMPTCQWVAAAAAAAAADHDAQHKQ
jgi:hypothetical protein